MAQIQIPKPKPLFKRTHNNIRFFVIDENKTVQCPTCQSTDIQITTAVAYSRFRTQQISHEPSYYRCQNCGAISSLTRQQDLELALYVYSESNIFGTDELRAASQIIENMEGKRNAENP